MRLLSAVLAITALWTTGWATASIDAFQSAQPASEWKRYTVDGEEFSALLPKPPAASKTFRPPTLLRSPKPGRAYAAYQDGAGYVVLSFDNDDREDLSVFISEVEHYGIFYGGATFERDVTLNDFKGKQYRVKSSTGEISGLIQFYRTASRIYIFEAIGEERSQTAIERFVKSITLGPMVKKQESVRLAPNGESAASSPAAPPPAAESSPAAQSEPAPVYPPREVTRKAVLFVRAQPQYTELAREHSISGTVVLRAIFSSSGYVTNIRAVSGLPYGLTEQAIAAARQIRFIPAVKDGRYVSQHVQIEYNFNLY